MNHGKLIKEAREKQGMSQQELGEKLKLKSPRTRISKIESGANITLDLFFRICKALGIKRIDLEK